MKPVLQALLVADHVYRDALTNKTIVAGIFHNLGFSKATPKKVRDESGEAKIVIPVSPGGHRVGSPFCYIGLVDVHGDQPFELRYVDLEEDKALFHANLSVTSPNPIQPIEIIVPLPLLPITKAGTFALELLWNNEPLGSHRIIVQEMKEEEKADGD